MAEIDERRSSTANLSPSTQQTARTGDFETLGDVAFGIASRLSKPEWRVVILGRKPPPAVHAISLGDEKEISD